MATTTKKRSYRGAPLNLKNAWRVVQVVFKHRHGICLTVEQLRAASLISNETYRAMNARIAKHGAENGLTGYYFGLDYKAGADYKRIGFVDTIRAEIGDANETPNTGCNCVRCRAE